MSVLENVMEIGKLQRKVKNKSKGSFEQPWNMYLQMYIALIQNKLGKITYVEFLT